MGGGGVGVDGVAVVVVGGGRDGVRREEREK